jgi:hypothetical protein
VPWCPLGLIGVGGKTPKLQQQQQQQKKKLKKKKLKKLINQKFYLNLKV